MKREALRHPKTHDLAARLKISRPEALGHLALLWDWTADYAIAGNIGKHPNGSIARACDWMHDPDQFVEALVAAGWVDRDDVHRLVIHDWAQHCENWIRAKAEKLGITLLGKAHDDSQRDSQSGSQNTTSESNLRMSPKSRSFPRDRTEPNQSHPIQSKLIPTDPTEAVPNGSRKMGGSGGIYKKVTLKMLSSVALLMEWLNELGEPDLSPDDHKVRLGVVGLAVRVTTRSAIKNPVACFISLLKDRDWNKVSDDELREAKGRLALWDAANSKAEYLANMLRAIPPEPVRKEAKDEIERFKEHWRMKEQSALQPGANGEPSR